MFDLLKRFKPMILALAGASTATACQTLVEADPTPALLVHSERAAPEALKAAVREALGGRDVRLGFDSLTKKSTLIVETGSSDPRMMGDRNIPKADFFDLMMSGEQCYLLHRETGKQYPLTGVTCQAVKP